MNSTAKTSREIAPGPLGLWLDRVILAARTEMVDGVETEVPAVTLRDMIGTIQGLLEEGIKLNDAIQSAADKYRAGIEERKALDRELSTILRSIPKKARPVAIRQIRGEIMPLALQYFGSKKSANNWFDRTKNKVGLKGAGQKGNTVDGVETDGETGAGRPESDGKQVVSEVSAKALSARVFSALKQVGKAQKAPLCKGMLSADFDGMTAEKFAALIDEQREYTLSMLAGIETRLHGEGNK